MADLTKIEWCDATLNLWWGCTKVSEGCKFCYAENLADHRYNKGNWGPTGTRKEVKSWRSTLNKISKRAHAEGRRLKVFCQSMSDTFEEPETMGGKDSENWKLVSRLQDELLAAVVEHQELDFLLLTKRPHNVGPVVHYHDGDPMQGEGVWRWPDNLWLGTSVESASVGGRVTALNQYPAKVRFLSVEPLIDDPGILDLSHIDWVIVGGESGAKARPLDIEWVRSIKRQCDESNTAFFMKQGGQNNWPNFKDFASFPADIQVRDFPQAGVLPP